MDVERQRKNRPSRMIACAEPLSSGNRPTHNTRLRDGVLLAATGHTPSDAGAEDPAPAPAHERKILTASCSRRPRAVATGGALALRGRAVLLRSRQFAPDHATFAFDFAANCWPFYRTIMRY
jgi:hypothetical protein